MLEPLAGLDALPCIDCPRVLLGLSMECSQQGKYLNAALAIDWAVRCGLQVRMDEVSYREFLRLRVLAEEKQVLEKEIIDRDREKSRREQERFRGR